MSSCYTIYGIILVDRQPKNKHAPPSVDSFQFNQKCAEKTDRTQGPIRVDTVLLALSRRLAFPLCGTNYVMSCKKRTNSAGQRQLDVGSTKAEEEIARFASSSWPWDRSLWKSRTVFAQSHNNRISPQIPDHFGPTFNFTRVVHERQDRTRRGGGMPLTFFAMWDKKRGIYNGNAKWVFGTAGISWWIG